MTVVKVVVVVKVVTVVTVVYKKKEPMGSSHGLEDYLDLFRDI